MAEQKNVQEQDINQLIKVRRDKLKELQEKSSNLAQSRAIERYCGLDKFDRDLFTKLYMNQSLSKDDITMLNSQLTPIIKTIKDKNANPSPPAAPVPA